MRIKLPKSRERTPAQDVDPLLVAFLLLRELVVTQFEMGYQRIR